MPVRAYQALQLGQLEHFALTRAEVHQPAPGQVRVAVEATALGYVDQLVMRGLYQVKPPLPFVPGGEIVGTVEAIGAGVTGFVLGQRVASWQFGGGLANTALLAAEHTVAVPDGLAPETVAALLLDFLTAYYGLYDRGGLKPGQTVLVTGASGGVGSAAVQLASSGAARVIALASGPEKQAMAAELGAELVIDYRDAVWRNYLKQAFPGGVDRVFDPVGGALFEPCFRSLAKTGRHLVVGFAGGDAIPVLPANLPLLKSAELVGVDARYLWESDPARVRQILSSILNLAKAGRIRAVIDQLFSLDQAAAAIARITQAQRLGKVVVAPQGTTQPLPANR